MKLTILCKKPLVDLAKEALGLVSTSDQRVDMVQIIANFLHRFPKCLFLKRRPETSDQPPCTNYAVGSHGFCLKCRKRMDDLVESLSENGKYNVGMVTVEVLGNIIRNSHAEALSLYSEAREAQESHKS